ncbi:FecR family protein [Caulobacter hibisci]|nr:FecR family protein [Caulobacter hibisci]
MIGDRQRIRRRDKEAAGWFTRLNDTSVPVDAIEAFDAWRSKPANDAAYRRMEDIARGASSLKSDPEIAALATQARQPASRDRPAPLAQRPPRYLTGLAFAGAIAVSAAVVIALPRSTYSTGVGEQTIARLDDGSAVRLNTDTRLRVRFTAGERRIELLQGEAFFDVAHDGARPFVVSAGDAQVRALGTRFDVRRDGHAVQVVLAQGKVRVTQARQDRAWTMTPGQALTLSPTQAPAAPASVDVAASTSWTSGRLSFDGVPLSQAVAEINRYSRRKIVLDADAPSQQRVTGAFKVGDSDSFIAAVGAIYGLEPKARWDGSVVLTPTGAPS